MTYAPYRDPSLPVEQRVADLLARLTLEEKAGQLTQYFYFAQTVEIPEGFDLSTLPPEHLAYVTQPRQVEAALDDTNLGRLITEDLLLAWGAPPRTLRAATEQLSRMQRAGEFLPPVEHKH